MPLMQRGKHQLQAFIVWYTSHKRNLVSIIDYVFVTKICHSNLFSFLYSLSHQCIMGLGFIVPTVQSQVQYFRKYVFI